MTGSHDNNAKEFCILKQLKCNFSFPTLLTSTKNSLARAGFELVLPSGFWIAA